jgi:hypothetical protein
MDGIDDRGRRKDSYVVVFEGGQMVVVSRGWCCKKEANTSMHSDVFLAGDREPRVVANAQMESTYLAKTN